MHRLATVHAPLGAILHSSNEPGELSQWLCHDDITINIVVLIIIIIIIIIIPVDAACRMTYCEICEVIRYVAAPV